VEVVKLLLSRCNDVDIIDNHGYTCLHHAYISDHIEVVKLLLVGGASIDDKILKDMSNGFEFFEDYHNIIAFLEFYIATSADSKYDSYNFSSGDVITAFNEFYKQHNAAITRLLLERVSSMNRSHDHIELGAAENVGIIESFLQAYEVIDEQYKLVMLMYAFEQHLLPDLSNIIDEYAAFNFESELSKLQKLVKLLKHGRNSVACLLEETANDNIESTTSQIID